MFEAFVHAIFWPFFLGGLVGLMSISNPLSKIPLFVSLTGEMSERERRETARKACLYGFAILTFTLFFGVFILEAFGISYGALRIAGGLTVALLGYRMLFGYGYAGLTVKGGKGNIAVFPLALPAISGPGAIAVVIGISTEIAELKTATLKAVAMGLVIHQMGGWDADKARAAFAIPPEFTPMAMIAIGYQAEPDTIDDPEVKKKELTPRARKPLAERFFEGGWGKGVTG